MLVVFLKNAARAFDAAMTNTTCTDALRQFKVRYYIPGTWKGVKSTQGLIISDTHEQPGRGGGKDGLLSEISLNSKEY